MNEMIEHFHEILVGFGIFAVTHLFAAVWMAATMRSDLRYRKEAEVRHEAALAEAKREHNEAIRAHTDALNEMRDSFEKMARTFGERLVAVETEVRVRKDISERA